MKNIKFKYFSLLIIVCCCSIGCEKQLEEELFSQISSDNLLDNEEGIFSLLSSAYGYVDYTDRWYVNTEEFTTDIAFQTGGFENGVIIPFLNFTWDPSTRDLAGFYSRGYNAIRDVNVLLENIESADLDDEIKQGYISEAKFLRAISYIRMYQKYGPVPLRTSTIGELNIPRATANELELFIESELLESIPNLPEPGEEVVYGRVNKGGALGILCKFYLNTKQWQKAADIAQTIIDFNYYDLYPVFSDMLKVENEINREMIWANIAIPNSDRNKSNTYISAAFPPGFREWPETGLTFQSNWSNPQTQYRLRDDFYNSFEAEDLRKNSIMTTYINGKGETIDLLQSLDNTRSFRYYPDPNAIGENHGNDIPEVRYADILLSRAEALNEISGPNMESISLINEVRERAGVSLLTLSEFPTKDALRDHLLKERSWEFYSEGKRREDLIRMDKYIEFAQNRGLSNAQQFHRVFPLPQNAMDSNPLLVQNEGY